MWVPGALLHMHVGNMGGTFAFGAAWLVSPAVWDMGTAFIGSHVGCGAVMGPQEAAIVGFHPSHGCVEGH